MSRSGTLSDCVKSIGQLAIDCLLHDCGVSKDFKEIDMKRFHIVCDLDGVITDSTSLYTKDGKVAKSYGAYDPELMTILKALGANFYFCTADEKGELIHLARYYDTLKKYGEIHTKCKWYDRVELVNKIKEEDPTSIIFYIGDSLSDINLQPYVNWLYCTANAEPSLKKRAAYVSPSEGGHGGLSECLRNILVDYF